MKKVFFYKQIFSIFGLIFLVSCAGKQISQEKLRFIPPDKKTIYVSSVINYTSFLELEQELGNYIIDYYRIGGELAFEPVLRQADVYLEIEIKEYFTNNIPVLPTHPPKSRFFMKLKVNLKDIKNKTVYVDGAKLELSSISELDRNFIEDSIKRAREALYEKVCENIDKLINDGYVVVKSQFGYEGLEKKDKPFFNKTIENTYGNVNESRFEEEARQETNRQRKIDRLDREGISEDF